MSSQVIMSENGTIYHIHLKQDDGVPNNIFLVGSAKRVDMIAKYFDTETLESRNPSRPEFYLKAGVYKGINMAAFSCGIGMDNIEIVLNELHALFEYDKNKDEWSKERARLNLIRVGTCGTSLPYMDLGTLAISEYAIGLDNLGAYYPSSKFDIATERITKKFLKTPVGKVNPLSYTSSANPETVSAIKGAAIRMGENIHSIRSGITISSPGFFAPEGRSIGRIRSRISKKDFQDSVQNFIWKGKKIINLEMESSLLFRLAYEQLSYNVGTICVVLDNLESDEVIDMNQAKERMNDCILVALEAMVNLN